MKNWENISGTEVSRTLCTPLELGAHCQGHLPGDVARRECLMARSVNLVTVIFILSEAGARECYVQGIKRLGELASRSLAPSRGHIGLVGGKAKWASSLLQGSVRPSIPRGQIGPKEMVLLMANLLSESRALFFSAL